MMAVPYDQRQEAVHKSYDSKGTLQMRKLRAVERLLTVLWRRTAPDFRLVHRFHLWQANDVTDVLHVIFLQSQHKSRRYRQSLLTLLSRRVQRGQAQAMHRWQLRAQQVRSAVLCPEVLRAAAKLAGVIVGRSLSGWGRQLFPLYSRMRESDSASRFQLALALSIWTGRSVGCLLYEARRERGATKLAHVLFLKVAPDLRRACGKLRTKRGWKMGICCLFPALHRVLRRLWQFSWILLNPTKAPSKLRFAAAKLFISAVKRATFYGKCWRKLKSASPDPAHFALKRGLNALRKSHKMVLLKAISSWKSDKPQDQLFESDIAVIRNQMLVAELLEQQIQASKQRAAMQVRKLRLRQLCEVWRRGVRELVKRWRARAGGIQEALLFEYVQFLEEQNGIAGSRAALLGANG